MRFLLASLIIAASLTPKASVAATWYAPNGYLLGNLCQTPYGIYAMNNWGPVGAGCYVYTPYGIQNGFIPNW